ncbi:peptide deformylase [Microbacterium halimionae]|nr:peptide deformylase [Microbacterium halimionae]
MISTIDAGTHALVRDLLDTVELPGRAGVAAPQIGVGVRAFSYNIDGDIGYILNPTLVEVRGEPEPIGEGCLSVPGLWHDTPRYPWAKAVGIDLEGNEVVLEGEGLLAQALQHETDHLDGKLYLDRLTPPTRREAMREVRESDWF